MKFRQNKYKRVKWINSRYAFNIEFWDKWMELWNNHKERKVLEIVGKIMRQYSKTNPVIMTSDCIMVLPRDNERYEWTPDSNPYEFGISAK